MAKAGPELPKPKIMQRVKINTTLLATGDFIFGLLRLTQK
jgi:hypothetical protein